MNWSTRLTRRRVVAGGSTLAALTALSAAAQTAPVTGVAGCEIGFVNGLLQIGGTECTLMTPPGLGAAIDPPSTLTQFVADDGTISPDGAVAADGTTTTETQQQVRTERLQAKRDKRRTQRGRRTDRQHDQNTRSSNRRRTRRTNRQTKRDAVEAAKVYCEEFDYQEDAQKYLEQEWISDGDRERLDPNGDRIACVGLPSRLSVTPTAEPAT